VHLVAEVDTVLKFDPPVPEGSVKKTAREHAFRLFRRFFEVLQLRRVPTRSGSEPPLQPPICTTNRDQSRWTSTIRHSRSGLWLSGCQSESG
jgi:hypothetical protein